MMPYIIRPISIFVLLLISCFSYHTKAEVVVITNSASDLNELIRRQMVNLYTGRILTSPGGDTLVPLDQPIDSIIRQKFYYQLTGKSVAAMNAYWARLLFTGRALPPKELSDSGSILKEIEKKPNTIGYIYIEEINDNVKIIFRFQDHVQ